MTITGINFSKGSIISGSGVKANKVGITMAAVLAVRHFYSLVLDNATKVKKIRKNRLFVWQMEGRAKRTKIEDLAEKTGNFSIKCLILPALNTIRKPCDNEANSNQMLSL